MSSARRVRRKYYVLQEKRIEDLCQTSQPLSKEAAALRNAMLADRDMYQSFEEQENEHAWARRRRSLVATAQIVLTLLTVVALGVAGAAVVLNPTLLAVLSLGAVLTAVIGLLIATWRWALRDEGERAALRPVSQQLVLDFVAARRRRRAA